MSAKRARPARFWSAMIKRIEKGERTVSSHGIRPLGRNSVMAAGLSIS